MKQKPFKHLILLGFILTIFSYCCSAEIILIDGESPETGSLLGTTPLVLPFGTVTFAGAFRNDPNDPEFIAAGASNNIFNVNGTLTLPKSSLTFDFDVKSITFVYGGNAGNINVQAKDINNVVVASFVQADTGPGQPAGPVTLSATAIRSLVWTDTFGRFAPLDNIQLLTSTLGNPSLAIRSEGSNAAVLFWPTIFSGYSLQSSTNFVDWLAVTNSVTIQHVNYSVLTDTSRGVKFFRLRK